MSHKDVLEQFNSIFPSYAEHMIEWFPNGNSSVRVRLEHGRDYAFTYHSELNWKLETIDSFIRSM